MEYRELKGAEREPQTKKAVSQLFLSFTEAALQLVSKEARKKIENSIQLVSGASSDTEKLCRHGKEGEDSERLLEGSRDDALATEGFTMATVRTSSGSSVSRAALYK